MRMGAPTRPSSADRRRHPRRAVNLPVVVVAPDGAAVPCESMDVSLGGMRVRGADRLPLGRVRVILDEMLALEGDVIEELIDVSSGQVTARIAFTPGPAALEAELTELASLDAAAVAADGARRARVKAVVAVAGLLGVLVVGGAVLRAGSGAGALPATPAVMTITQQVDHLMSVTISADPGASYATSTVLPSAGVDRVRVLAQFTPTAVDGGFPVSVTVENRGDDVLTLGGARLTALQDGVPVADVVLSSDDVVEVAPGETVSLDGVLALAPGTYELVGGADVG
jgi:hypothetical protein